MENKVIIELLIPEIDEKYDVFIPINKKIGNIIMLLNESIRELSNDSFPISNYNQLINRDTLQIYEADTLIKNTDIRNGTKIIFITNKGND